MSNMNPRPEGDDLLEKLVAVNRVAKVVKGGRQFGFSALTEKCLSPSRKPWKAPARA
jgi:ribosomal protein S5